VIARLLQLVVVVVAVWVVFVVGLVALRPKGMDLRSTVQVVPDTVRMLRALRRDPATPPSARRWLAALVVYLAVPLDLVPDFIPVLGYADDAIIVAAALRSVVRRTGIRAVERHWPGTHDGFAALCRLTGLTPGEAPRPAGQPPAQQD